MTIEQILEIIENYKLRMPPTVFYELKADIVNFEEPTTKNDLGVDCISRERLKQIVFNITAEYDTETIHIDRLIDEIDNLPSVTPQLSVPEVTALAEWTAKLTKASEDAYNKGYVDGMKAQEPKSEWEHDHEILKAYADGANEVLDKIRAEIETKYGQCDICEYFEDYDYEENDISEYRPIGNIADILQILDNYKAE